MLQIQFWKTAEGVQTMREHSIIYREPGHACWSSSTSSHDRPSWRDVNSGHVYSLWPFSNITAQIRALNANYDGPPSASIAFVTAEGGTLRSCSPRALCAAGEARPRDDGLCVMFEPH